MFQLLMPYKLKMFDEAWQHIQTKRILDDSTCTNYQSIAGTLFASTNSFVLQQVKMQATQMEIQLHKSMPKCTQTTIQDNYLQNI